MKDLYLIWNPLFLKFPKPLRYSIGSKIDTLFVNLIEDLSIAGFLQKSEKISYLRRAGTRLDTLKVFVHIAWELHLLELKQYEQISEKLENIGGMIGGWHNQVEEQLKKQNSSGKTEEK